MKQFTTKLALVIFVAAAVVAAFVVRDAAEQSPAKSVEVRASSAPAPLAESASLAVGRETSVALAPEATSTGAAAAAQNPAPQAATGSDALADDDGLVYPGARVDATTLRKLHGDQPLTADHPHVLAAIEVKNRNAKWIMALPSVVGTGVGLNDKGEVAVHILTKAGATDLPQAIEGIPVVTVNTGEITARQQLARQAKPQKGKPQPPPTDPPPPPPPPPPPARPARIGTSTSLDEPLTVDPDGTGWWTAGIIGCRVKNGAGTYALSNFHVYSWRGVVTVGGIVLQPGSLDSKGIYTDGSDALGTVSMAATIVYSNSDPNAENKVDAAIAKVNGTLDVKTPDGGWGTPYTATRPATPLNLPVVKYGRTTGQTSGKVAILSVDINVGYEILDADNRILNVTARFVDQFAVVGPSRKSPFSAGGDSGSLIVTLAKDDQGNQIFDGTGKAVYAPVGLLFAGGTSMGVDYTSANRIDEVLTAMGVIIDDGK